MSDVGHSPGRPAELVDVLSDENVEPELDEELNYPGDDRRKGSHGRQSVKGDQT